MRIGFNFHTTDEYISGVEYYSLGLLNSLLAIDQENEYVVFTNQPMLLKRYVADSKNLTIRDLSCLRRRIVRIAWEHFGLPAVAKRERLDVLHCPHYICPVFKCGVPYVVTMHDIIAIDHPSWCKTSNSLYYGIFLKKSLSRCERVVAVSECTAEDIHRRFDVDQTKVSIIRSGIDSCFNDAADHIKEQEVRSKYGLPDKYVLCVGNIEPKKNISSVLQALNVMRQKGMPRSFVLVGKRSWKSRSVWEQIQSCSECKDVVITGYVERSDLSSVYKMADVFISCSLCEGFGFPALEAMACGTPVVATRVGVLREISQDAFTVVNPDDTEQIANAICNLIADDKSRQQQIETAREESQKFQWHDCAKRMLSIYREVANAKN